nr:hypothetical protein [Tanacetum cinerariifolium]
EKGTALWFLRFGSYVLSLAFCGPYKPTTVLVQAVAATDNSPAIPKHTIVETPMNMYLENKAHFQAEKEAIHMILTGIGDEIYSTVDACQTAQEMWEAIKRLQQGESLNIQDRTVNVAGARENVGSPVVKQSGIQCFNCKEFGHFAKECRKPKRVKDSAYHKEKMLLCKQAEQGVPLQAEQYDWLADTDEEIDEQEFEARYSYMAKIQENDQNDVESDVERVALANLKLDVDENKKIQKQLKKANTTLAQELKECKTILARTSKTLGESNSVRDSCLAALQNKQTEFEKYKAFNDRTIDYDKLEQIIDNAWIKHSKDQFRAPTAQDMKILIQTCLMPLAIKTQNDSFIFLHELKQEMHADLKHVESLEKEIYELESDKAEFSNMYDMILQECVSKDVMCSYFLSLSDLDALDELQYLKAQLQDKNIAISELKKLIEKGKGKFMETKFNKPSIVRQPNAQRIPKPSVIGKPTPFSNSLERRYFPKTKPVPKTNVSEGLSKPVTAQTLPQTARQAVSNTNVLKPGMYRIDNRTKKPNVVPISTRKPKGQANKSVATPHKKKVASKSNNQKPQSYFRMLYEKTSKTWKWWIEQQSPSGYKWVPKTKMQWVPKAKNEIVQKRVSFTVDNASRITNVLKRTNSLGSNLSIVPSSSTLLQIVQLILFIFDSECTKHMTGNLKLLCNFVEKFLGTVCFGNDQFAPIFRYGDLVAFRKSTCFVRDLRGNDLLTGNRGSDLYTTSLQESTSLTPLCLMAKASPTQAWLWHRRLSHLNFNYINRLSKKDIVIGLPKLKYVKDQICSSYELSKEKRSSFKSKVVSSSKRRLNLLHMDLCGPMRVASINEKKYILVIVDDYSRYTWTLFLYSKD